MKRGILTTFVLLLTGAFTFYACDNVSDQAIEESLEVIPEVTPIQGAQNSTVTVSDGDQSYFKIDFSNIVPNEFIDNSTREAWCIDYKKPIASGGAVHEGLSISYATGERWQPIRRLVGMKDNILENNPEVTYREIQVAIWALLDFPKFDIDKITVDNIPRRMVSNGEFNFDREIAKNLVNLAVSGNTSTQRSLIANSESAEKDGVELCVVVTDSDTQTVIVPCKDTFWAFGQVSFLDGTDELFTDKGQWGWVFKFYSQDKNPDSTPLIAGAGGDKNLLSSNDLSDHWIGFLNVELDNNSLSVEYEAYEQNEIKEAHLWVGCNYITELPVEGQQNNVPPGQLPFSHKPDNPFGSYTFELTIGDSNDHANNQIASCPNGEYHIAAHGVAKWGNIQNEITSIVIQ
jgi:hypothetical protein